MADKGLKRPPVNRLIPELSDSECAIRSDMMRLYASRADGDDYLPAPLVHTADALLAQGWIETVGHGYLMTECGVKAWARMVAPLTKAQKNPAMNELRVHAGLPLALRRRMNAASMSMLRRLIETGPLSPKEYEDDRHKTLVNYRFIIVGNDRITITAAGRAAYEHYRGARG